MDKYKTDSKEQMQAGHSTPLPWEGQGEGSGDSALLIEIKDLHASINVK